MSYGVFADSSLATRQPPTYYVNGGASEYNADEDNDVGEQLNMANF